jgi:chromosome partitioning protein
MLPAMAVVCVLNYKGGVGKTTVTANLGAELANRGLAVLLVDLDPQASLTLSFYTADEMARELSEGGTILHWFRAHLHDQRPDQLSRYVVTPPQVDRLVRLTGGRLDLVPSHLGLIDVDLDLAAYVGGSRFDLSGASYLWVHRLLADALADDALRGYDVVLLDCAPNFNLVTRTAVVASDRVLIPAKADYLSTLGIDVLRRKLAELVRDVNAMAGPDAIDPTVLGVVFTMIQYARDAPILAVRNYVQMTGQYQVPVFHQMIRESKTLFATAGERGIPAVLMAQAYPTIQQELRELATEFLDRLALVPVAA